MFAWMNFLRNAAGVAAVVAVAGCAAPGRTYTVADVKRETRLCYDQAYADQDAKAPDWFTRYLDCSRTHIMPIEVYVYRKEAEIRTIYEEMYKIAPWVDRNVVPVSVAYGKWDRLRADLLDERCALRIEEEDGGDRCLMRRIGK